MPTARILQAVVANSGRVFVIGGARTDYSSLDTVEAYTP
jgi:hypothetical protein